MTSTARERRLIETFLALTDTLTGEFDTVDFLTMLAERSTDLLGVSATGVVLTDGRGGLSVAAGSFRRSELREVFAAATEAGPCRDCVDSDAPVSAADLRDTDRWPRFRAAAAAAGFAAVHAVPMRSHERAIGAVTFLHDEPRRLDAADARLGQALADAATIGLLHEQAARRAETVAQQLRSTLQNRVILEQAKGVVAAQGDVSPADAFTILRAHALSQGLHLSDLARGVVERTVDVATVIRSRP